MTVREHIKRKLETLEHSPVRTFRTSDIQELAFEGKAEFGKFLGSTETYTREFRRMRTDGVIVVEKLDRKNRQQTWRLSQIRPTNSEMGKMYKEFTDKDLPF
tara:strand:- start:289 stop:594 length:306 start_codon:yes stop_codon:yes gene_type:complete